jgi:predicted phosphodiesterase
MAKIRVMSDVHIEFGELPVPTADADVAVLAGDVHVGFAAAAWADALARQLDIPVVLIAGNHEHYNSLSQGRHLAGIVDGLRKAAAASAGRVAFLERDAAVVAGIRFVGCTLWTDFELYGDPGKAMAQAEISMNDFRSIAYRPGVRFTARDACAEFVLGRQFLERELAKPFEGSTVVVTHHLPSLKSVAPRFANDGLNPAFASRLDALVERSGAALWIHGHSHDSADYTLGKTRVICNPRGYHDVELNPRFDPALTVEIG